MSLMSTNNTECLIEELFGVTHIQLVISLLIFLDYAFVTYNLPSYKVMHSKLTIFWNPVEKLRVLVLFSPLSFMLFNEGLMKVNW